MRIQEHITNLFKHHFAALCIFCLICGTLSGNVAAAFAFAVPWLMALLMFCNGIGLRTQNLHCLHEKPWILPLSLLLFHIAIPVLWVSIGFILKFPPEAVMGFAILAVIPISASCLVWIGVNRANTALGTALLLVDTLAAPFIIPYVLAFIFGANIHMDPLLMLRGLSLMLLLPTCLALLCNRISHGGLQRKAGKPLAVAGKLSILVILFINGGVVSPYLTNPSGTLITICAATLCFSALLFLVTFISGMLLFTDKDDILAFMLCSIRTTTSGMVIAMAYFPPLTIVTVAFNMLFQQPLGAWAGQLASRYLENRSAKTNHSKPALKGMHGPLIVRR